MKNTSLLILLILIAASWVGSLPVMADEADPALSSPADRNAAPLEPSWEDPFDVTTDEGADDSDTVADPLIGFNRVMFKFNDKMYFWVLKPVASGYRVVVPTPVRVSLKNFFFNLLGPVRFVNCLLQGKGRAAEAEFCRFVVNTTAGFLGFFDPVQDKPQFNPHQEDFGQTLATYKVGNGFYIVWPVFGPSTLRDTVGSVGDWALNPFSFMQLVNLDAGALTSGTTNVAIYSVRTINTTSFHIGDYEALKNAALDPYEAFRNAYIQNRNSKIAQ
jgi:phospholipid-binding lipoprotein MlaA